MFDFVIVNAKKPTFFEKGNNNDAFLYDTTIKDCKGKILDGKILEKQIVYLEGNYSMIEESIKKEKSIKSPRVAYIGDHYIEDSISPARLPNWTAITVIQELYKEKGFEEKSALFSSEKCWGNYFMNENEPISLWIDVLIKYKVFPIPSIKNICDLIK